MPNTQKHDYWSMLLKYESDIFEINTQTLWQKANSSSEKKKSMKVLGCSSWFHLIGINFIDFCGFCFGNTDTNNVNGDPSCNFS